MNKTTRYTLLFLFAALFVFPILWVFLSSLKPQSELFTFPLSILPNNPTLHNYFAAFREGDFLLYFKNSMFVSVAATLITVLINTMAGYALSKFIFKGRDIIFYVMIATLMIPLQVIMVPIFLL